VLVTKEKSKNDVKIFSRIKKIDILLKELRTAFDELKESDLLSKEDVDIILEELRDITSGKDDVIEQVDRDIIDLYKRFFERYQDKAIALIDDRSVCSGCFVKITPIKFAKIKTKKGIEFCEQCGRILVWRDTD